LKERHYNSGSFTPWQTTRRNPWVGKSLMQKAGLFEGVTDSQLPASASQVPFVWEYLETKFNYQFIAGVLTVAQDKEKRAIRPRIGWAVRQASQ